MINRAEQRACGCSRGSRRLDKKGQKRVNRKPCVKRRLGAAAGRRLPKLTSNRTGENPPYGMIRGGGGNVRHGLAVVCHDARKSRNNGSRWPKLGAPPLHSTPHLLRRRRPQARSELGPQRTADSRFPPECRSRREEALISAHFIK